MSSIFLLFEKNISLSIFLILDQISLFLSRKEARVLIKLVLTKKECMLIFFQPHRSKHSIAANRITTTMIHGRLMSSANSDVWNTVNRVFFFAIVLIWKFAVLENVCWWNYFCIILHFFQIIVFFHPCCWMISFFH